MRVILDTNTLVSALLIRQSIPRQAFDKAKQEGILRRPSKEKILLRLVKYNLISMTIVWLWHIVS